MATMSATSHRGQTESAISHNNLASVANRVVPWVASHPDGWTINGHFGACGQSCPCCRAFNPEDRYSGCPICIDVWELSGASKSMLVAVKENGRTQPRRRREPESMLSVMPARWRSYWSPWGWHWANSPQFWSSTWSSERPYGPWRWAAPSSHPAWHGHGYQPQHGWSWGWHDRDWRAHESRWEWRSSDWQATAEYGYQPQDSSSSSSWL